MMVVLIYINQNITKGSENVVRNLYKCMAYILIISFLNYSNRYL